MPAESEGEGRALIVRGPISLSDVLSSMLFDAGARGVEVRERGRRVELIVYCDASEAPALTSAIRPLLEDLADRNRGAKKVTIALERVLDDWKTAWTESLRPVQLTDSFIVCPGSSEPQGSASKSVIRLNPGLVFGYGEHPTTRLVAERVEAFCKRRRGCSVLDVGTGTGVLAILAALCGARRVVGVDIDVAAIRAAERNARDNAVAICHFTDAPLEAISEQFDCVVANVDTMTLVRLRDDILRFSKRGGLLLLTGFVAEDAEPIRAAYETGCDFLGGAEEPPWVVLELRRRVARRKNATR